ncbi:MAG: 2-oxo acid dehydrogenase subunit E2, partial [Pseudomonadota bacterium]
MTDIMTPALGESVTEATVARWAKKPGEAVTRDEVLVELETDKVSLEVAAPETGVLSAIDAEEGATVVPGQRLGRVGASAGKVAAPAPAAQPAPSKPAPANAATLPLAPSVQRIVAEQGLDAAAIVGSGKDGRITKGDALAALEARAARPAEIPPPAPPREVHAREERVRMTRLRQTIARRLKEAQATAAMLTTFNEVDMTAIMALRGRYKDTFEKRHGVKLGFMGFFVKACVAALKDVPTVNAEIEGQDLIYKNHYDIGVAVGTERGLVVPVVRDADALSLADVEREIAALGRKA